MNTNTRGILNKNEDLISAIVENLQLGRYDDCFKQYLNLQSNLMILSNNIDSYPPGEDDPYQFLFKLPDKLMHEDILYDIRLNEHRDISTNQHMEPCFECFHMNKSIYECRIKLGHVDVSHLLSSSESDDFDKVTRLLLGQYKDYCQQESLGIKTTKRKYRRWNPHEIHTLMIAISMIGSKDHRKLALALEDRTPHMIRGYISQNFTKELLDHLVRGQLPSPPANYVRPSSLLKIVSSSLPIQLALSSQTEQDISQDDIEDDYLSDKGEDFDSHAELTRTSEEKSAEASDWKNLIAMAISRPVDIEDIFQQCFSSTSGEGTHEENQAATKAVGSYSVLPTLYRSPEGNLIFNESLPANQTTVDTPSNAKSSSSSTMVLPSISKFSIASIPLPTNAPSTLRDPLKEIMEVESKKKIIQQPDIYAKGQSLLSQITPSFSSFPYSLPSPAFSTFGPDIVNIKNLAVNIMLNPTLSYMNGYMTYPMPAIPSVNLNQKPKESRRRVKRDENETNSVPEKKKRVKSRDGPYNLSGRMLPRNNPNPNPNPIQQYPIPAIPTSFMYPMFGFAPFDHTALPPQTPKIYSEQLSVQPPPPTVPESLSKSQTLKSAQKVIVEEEEEMESSKRSPTENVVSSAVVEEENHPTVGSTNKKSKSIPPKRKVLQKKVSAKLVIESSKSLEKPRTPVENIVHSDPSSLLALEDGSSRLSFMDISNQHSYMGHHGDSYLLDGNTDVTLIAGLVNENSFM